MIYVAAFALIFGPALTVVIGAGVWRQIQIDRAAHDEWLRQRQRDAQFRMMDMREL